MPPIASRAFEDRVGEPGQAVLQMVGGADPAQTGADDHDVEVLHSLDCRVTRA